MRLFETTIYPSACSTAAPTTDGAAAAILCRAGLTTRGKKPPVLVRSAALAVESPRSLLNADERRRLVVSRLPQRLKISRCRAVSTKGDTRHSSSPAELGSQIV